MSGINRFTASDREPNFIQDQLSEEDAGLSISGNFGADSHLLHDYKEEILNRLNYQPNTFPPRSLRMHESARSLSPRSSSTPSGGISKLVASTS